MMDNIQNKSYNVVVAGLMVALGLIVPYATAHAFGVPGTVLLPMHIPVLLCGFAAGPAYAMIIGFAAPLLRLMIAGMPMPFMAIAMCFELAAYGLVSGALYKLLPKKTVYIYVSLAMAMLLGRFVWGAAAWQLWTTGMFPRLPNDWMQFGWEEFLSGAFVTAIPGIVLHILLIPAIVLALKKARLLVE